MIVEVFRGVSASPDSCWKIISSINMEQEYWTAIHSVHSNRVNSSTVERKVRVMKGLFSFRETVALRQSFVHVHITDGPFTGIKLIEVIPVGQFKTKLRIRWDIKLNRFLRVISPAISRYITTQSKKALIRMEARIRALDSDHVDVEPSSGTIS